MVNLITAIAFDPEMNLGRAYNNIMSRLNDDDWCCFIDHDVMFTTKRWYQQICDVIEDRPDAGIITCLTNRVGNPNQIFHSYPDDESEHNIIYHRALGEKLAKETLIRDVTNQHHKQLISGMLMCISKKVWNQIGGFKDGFLGVDNRAHTDVRDIGYKVYCIDSLYVYHWYRADGVHPCKT
jgi:GT2 family glycosyltransferase